MQRATHNPRREEDPARSLDKVRMAPAAVLANVARSRAGYFSRRGA